MTGRLSEDDEYLNKLAHERLEAAACPGGYRLETLRELPGPLLSRAIAMGVERVRRVRLESRHIEAVAGIVEYNVPHRAILFLLPPEATRLLLGSGAYLLSPQKPFCRTEERLRS